MSLEKRKKEDLLLGIAGNPQVVYTEEFVKGSPAGVDKVTFIETKDDEKADEKDEEKEDEKKLDDSLVRLKKRLEDNDWAKQIQRMRRGGDILSL